MKKSDDLISRINLNSIGYAFLYDKQYRIIIKAVISLIINVLFSLYNGILGVLNASLIFIVSAVYYLLLGLMRLLVLMADRKNSLDKEKQSASVVGTLLFLLSIVYSSIIFFTMRHNTISSYGEITMITIATFTFTKITVAIINALKHSSEESPVIMAVNNIRYSEVAVSLLTMQQSMLVSFGDMAEKTSNVLNACTGGAVCIFIVSLGIITLKNSRKDKENGKIKSNKSK